MAKMIIVAMKFSVTVYPLLPSLLPYARTDRGALSRGKKAERQALTDELQAKESIVGEMERKIAQLVTSARVKYERENRVWQNRRCRILVSIEPR